MDVKAPCEILRQYIYRSFRDQLNDTFAVGESFLFVRYDLESNREEMLPITDEFKTRSFIIASYTAIYVII